MKTYISMLRGINVSGQKKVPMADLRALYESLGFDDVQTYIQSGNVVFKAPPSTAAALEEKIEKAIKKKFSFSVPVVIRSQKDLDKALKNHPFHKETETPDRILYLTFFKDKPAAGNVKQLPADGPNGEKLVVKGADAYLFYPNGYGRSKVSHNFVENKLKVSGTTRNWKTVQTLNEMASGS